MRLQVGVKALIKNDHGKYLFLLRAHTMHDEDRPHWDIPGGRIDSQETLMTALRREIAEETGFMITQEPTLLQAQDIFAAEDLHVVRLTYTITYSDIVTLTLSDEHQEARWISLDEAKNLNMDPYLRTLLDTKEH